MASVVAAVEGTRREVAHIAMESEWKPQGRRQQGCQCYCPNHLCQTAEVFPCLPLLMAVDPIHCCYFPARCAPHGA